MESTDIVMNFNKSRVSIPNKVIHFLQANEIYGKGIFLVIKTKLIKVCYCKGQLS